MAKPYSIFKRSNGIFYAQFPFTVNGKTFQKSTGCRTHSSAEKTVLGWYSDGSLLPSHGNNRNPDAEKISVDKLAFFSSLRTMDFSSGDKETIVKILKTRGVILSAVLPKTPESKSAAEFILNFWNYEKSPYVKEKLMKGQTIHKCYCATMLSRVSIYWLPKITGRSLGSLTKKDVKDFFNDPVVPTLAPKTVNSIISSLTIPLKWAYYNELTENNCFDGIMKCANKSKTRQILTMEQAAAVFKVDWENDAAKLANAIAMYTGMRQGEIAGLRFEDIGVDRLYVKHSWSKYDGLKCCKNGEEREVPIAPSLRDALIAQANLNPYGEGMKGFIFFGAQSSHPTDPKNWLKYLHRALEAIGYSNPKQICFHSWRHLWCSRVSDIIKDKRLIMSISGHKTETMLDHYAEHLEEENALGKMKSVTEKLFLPMVEEAEESLSNKNTISA